MTDYSLDQMDPVSIQKNTSFRARPEIDDVILFVQNDYSPHFLKRENRAFIHFVVLASYSEMPISKVSTHNFLLCFLNKPLPNFLGR